MLPTGQISAECYTGDFSENVSRKYKFVEHRTKISGNLYKDLCRFHTVGSNVCSRKKNRRHCCGSKTKHTICIMRIVDGDVYTSTIQTVKSSIFDVYLTVHP